LKNFKKNQIIIFSLLLATAFTSTGCNSVLKIPNFHKEFKNINIDTSKLIRAINLIPNNPTQAEKQLLSFDIPTAKAYLAYLYFTDKVKIDNKYEKVNQLMNMAIKEAFIASKENSYGSINNYQTYSYNSLEFLLTHLRFIQELDYKNGIKTTIPCCLFAEHPKEAYNAFSVDWITSNGNYPALDSNFNSIIKLPDIKAFIDQADSARKTFKLNSENERLYEIRLLVSSVSPNFELDRTDKEYYEKLWNILKDLPVSQAFYKAQNSLAKYYIKQFGLSKAQANEASYNALSSMFEAKTGMFSINSLELFDNYLYKAAYSSDVNIKELSNYLQAKKPNQQNLDETLKLALRISQNIDAIRILLKSGAKIDKADKQTQVEAGNLLVKIISSAKPFGNPKYFGKPEVMPNEQILELIKLFLKAGIPVDNEDKGGETLLISSAKANNFELVRFFVNNGANVNKVTNYHYTALYWATQNSDSDINLVKILVENGADVNFKEDDGETPLMQAVQRENTDLVKYLIAHKASVHSCTGNNRTVLEHARNEEIKNILIQAGATK